jgi:hypothetical protein
MTLEQRVDALERRVTRYRGATMAMALVNQRRAIDPPGQAAVR